MIYLDNAATSFPKPPCVAEAMADALTRCGANPGRSGHALSLCAGRIVEGCREALAQMLGEVDASRVAFAFNATDALNMAIHGVIRSGDHVISSLIEHNSILRPLSELARSGFITLSLVPPEADGRISPGAIAAALTPRTRLVALTHMSNVLGSVQDAAGIGGICRRAGVLFLLDCAQTAGHYHLTPKEWGCSMLALPGHKGLLGPHGTGALWVKRGVTLAPMRQGGTGSASESMFQPRMMPDCLESGTLNLPGLAGLRAGMRHALSRQEAVRAHIVTLCDWMRAALSDIPGVRVYTQPGAMLTTFTVRGIGSQAAASRLDGAGIAVRGGLHCAPGVHRFLGTLEEGAIRVSPGHASTREDAGALVTAVRRMAAEI